MSRFVQEVKNQKETADKNPVVNFMGGVSYELNPLDTLKMVTSSSIFGEPSYYRGGEFSKSGIEKIVDGIYKTNCLVSEYSIIPNKYENMRTSDVMEKVIDESLDYDFAGTLDWAKILRHDFYMRLNPQVIMVRASIHKNRKDFTEKYPGKFSEINNAVMSRSDEPASQLTYWLYKNKNKNEIPSVLKRSWAKRIENMSKYDVYKYRNKGIGLIDTVRICHANSPIIDELMRTGTIDMKDDEVTWETLKSSGMSWEKIIGTIKINHMALVRNLRGIFEEINDAKLCNRLMDELKHGVEHGRQFPFRYFTAMKFVENSKANHKPIILDALEECIDIARNNMPVLKGKTMCLSDNSGSAWGSFNSEYGSMTIAEIDNLSSVITAQNSDEGYVGKFGDRLKIFPISKRNGALSQTKEITRGYSDDVGGKTEHGIWLFFKQAINKKEHWDNIFIYSDQQAGHGGLYGVGNAYEEYSFKGRYFDVMKMINKYRSTVNPKVNIFSVQTAGYDNVVIPESTYRGAILYGWTGKEIQYADSIIKFWNEKEKQ